MCTQQVLKKPFKIGQLFVIVNSQQTAILNSQDFRCGGIKSVQFDSFLPLAVLSIASRAACIPGSTPCWDMHLSIFYFQADSPNCPGWSCAHYLAQANPELVTLQLRLRAVPPGSIEAMTLRLLVLVVCILRQQVCLRTQLFVNGPSLLIRRQFASQVLCPQEYSQELSLRTSDTHVPVVNRLALWKAWPQIPAELSRKTSF